MRSYLKKMISRQEQLICQQACLIEINKQLLAEVAAFAPKTQPIQPTTEGMPAPADTAVSQALYNRKEAAAFLLVHPRSVTRYRLEGKLLFVRNDDSRIRYRREDLQACYLWKWGSTP